MAEGAGYPCRLSVNRIQQKAVTDSITELQQQLWPLHLHFSEFGGIPNLDYSGSCIVHFTFQRGFCAVEKRGSKRFHVIKDALPEVVSSNSSVCGDQHCHKVRLAS